MPKGYVRHNRRSPEALAERKRRSALVRKAAYLSGSNQALADLAGMKHSGGISQYITGDRTIPDWFVEVCEGVIEKGGATDVDH